MSTTSWCVARPRSQPLASSPCSAASSEMPAQPRAEPVELGVLELAQPRVAQRPAPEADLDLRLEVAPFVQRQGLQHDGAQRGQASQAGRDASHPGADSLVREHQRRPEYVFLVVEVVPEYAA